MCSYAGGVPEGIRKGWAIQPSRKNLYYQLCENKMSTLNARNTKEDMEGILTNSEHFILTQIRPSLSDCHYTHYVSFHVKLIPNFVKPVLLSTLLEHDTPAGHPGPVSHVWQPLSRIQYRKSWASCSFRAFHLGPVSLFILTFRAFGSRPPHVLTFRALGSRLPFHILHISFHHYFEHTTHIIPSFQSHT